jgi:hypothetical protein
MKSLISRAFAHISSQLAGLQVKRFLAVVLVGFLTLTTNIGSLSNTIAFGDQGSSKAHQSDSVRPETTNEWYDDARKTEDSPGERLEKIGEQSAQAVKEFGQMYSDTADRSTSALKEDTADSRKELSSKVQR